MDKVDFKVEDIKVDDVVLVKIDVNEYNSYQQLLKAKVVSIPQSHYGASSYFSALEVEVLETSKPYALGGHYTLGERIFVTKGDVSGIIPCEEKTCPKKDKEAEVGNVVTFVIKCNDYAYYAGLSKDKEYTGVVVSKTPNGQLINVWCKDVTKLKKPFVVIKRDEIKNIDDKPTVSYKIGDEVTHTSLNSNCEREIKKIIVTSDFKASDKCVVLEVTPKVEPVKDIDGHYIGETVWVGVKQPIPGFENSYQYNYVEGVIKNWFYLGMKYYVVKTKSDVTVRVDACNLYCGKRAKQMNQFNHGINLALSQIPYNFKMYISHIAGYPNKLTVTVGSTRYSIFVEENEGFRVSVDDNILSVFARNYMSPICKTWNYAVGVFYGKLMEAIMFDYMSDNRLPYVTAMCG